jgi:hypothetical protein
MRILSLSLVVVAAALFLVPATSQADDASITVSCAGGNVKVTPVSPWHINTKPNAPMRWSDGTKDNITEQLATFKGAKCTGSVTVAVCSGEACKVVKADVK